MSGCETASSKFISFFFCVRSGYDFITFSFLSTFSPNTSLSLFSSITFPKEPLSRFRQAGSRWWSSPLSTFRHVLPSEPVWLEVATHANVKRNILPTCEICGKLGNTWETQCVDENRVKILYRFDSKSPETLPNLHQLCLLLPKRTLQQLQIFFDTNFGAHLDLDCSPTWFQSPDGFYWQLQTPCKTRLRLSHGFRSGAQFQTAPHSFSFDFILSLSAMSLSTCFQGLKHPSFARSRCEPQADHGERKPCTLVFFRVCQTKTIFHFLGHDALKLRRYIFHLFITETCHVLLRPIFYPSVDFNFPRLPSLPPVLSQGWESAQSARSQSILRTGRTAHCAIATQSYLFFFYSSFNSS